MPEVREGDFTCRSSTALILLDGTTDAQPVRENVAFLERLFSLADPRGNECGITDTFPTVFTRWHFRRTPFNVMKRFPKRE